MVIALESNDWTRPIGPTDWSFAGFILFNEQSVHTIFAIDFRAKRRVAGIHRH